MPGNACYQAAEALWHASGIVEFCVGLLETRAKEEAGVGAAQLLGINTCGSGQWEEWAKTVDWLLLSLL